MAFKSLLIGIIISKVCYCIAVCSLLPYEPILINFGLTLKV